MSVRPSTQTTTVATEPPIDSGAVLHRIEIHNRVVHRIREFLREQGYVEVPVPELTPATGSCEVVDSMFSMDYFGALAFPRQTGQLYLEEVVALGMNAVYCEGESLRKEWKLDERHLTEFKLIEIERRDMSLDELCDFEERLLKDAASAVAEEHVGAANMARIDRMLRSPHPRITYCEAVDVLNARGLAVAFGDDLGRAEEAALIDHAGGLPIHVTHFPESLKFFNMKIDRGDPAVVECVDYILPLAGETFGGSLREPDVDILRRRLHDLGLKFDEIRTEFLGLNSCHGPIAKMPDVVNEVVLRVGVRSHDRSAVERFGKEIAPLILTGPPAVTGFAGGRPKPSEVIAYWPSLIPKKAIQPKVIVTEL